MRPSFRAASRLCVLLLVSALCACSGVSQDANSALGRQALIYAANQYLNQKDCADAVATLQPYYNSSNSDNAVRMAIASAYACYSGFSFFDFLSQITNNTSSLSGSAFWELLTQLFPSSASDPNDRVVEGALLATDALMAAIKPGAAILSSSLINPGSYNPGSVNLADRIDEANAYLVFVSMAAIGGIQNRFGNPNSSYQKRNDLPWSTAATVTSDGCAYASAMVNFADTIGSLASSGSSLASSFQSVQSAFQSVIYSACDIGCTNTTPGGAWVQSGCTVTTNCSNCPAALRDRTKCTGQANDQVSCAAAGVVNFINTTPLGWQTGP